MDERQAQIKEGEGLQESRVNEEFLDFLRKWSVPVLMILALVSLAYSGWNMLQQRKIAARDEAFGQLGAIESTADASIYSLTEIAEQYGGVGSVAEIALLRAADIHLDAVRTGISPDDGETELTAEDEAYHLEQAGSLYRQVLDRAEGDKNKALFAANAAFGIAAVAESQGDADAARAAYADAKRFAEAAGYAPLAGVADEMAASIDVSSMPELYSRDELPRLPFEDPPAAAPLETQIEVLPAEGDEPAGPPAGDDAGEADRDDAPAAEGPPEPADEPANVPADEPADPEDG